MSDIATTNEAQTFGRGLIPRPKICIFTPPQARGIKNVGLGYIFCVLPLRQTRRSEARASKLARASLALLENKKSVLKNAI